MPRPPLPERLTSQALSGEPLRSPEQVAERLLAVQGQDPRGARLAVRVRTVGVTAADVDRALSEERSLLITWLDRGTLQLVRSEDYPWLHALTTPPLLTSSTRRLRQEGVSADAAEKGMETIERALVADGPLSRPQLRERLNGAGVPTAGQAPTTRCCSAGPRARRALVTNNGLLRPFAMVEGRAVATWRLAGGKVTIEHLARVKKKDDAALEADAARVLEFLGA